MAIKPITPRATEKAYAQTTTKKYFTYLMCHFKFE